MIPVTSPALEIETELSIHAVDKRWRIKEIPVDYRDRPEGSMSKLSTYSDGFKVLKCIGALFKDYRPMALFGWLTLIFIIVALIFGIPIIVEYQATGLVPRVPTAILTVAFMGAGMLSLSCGLILDTVVNNNRKVYELAVTEAYRTYGDQISA